MRPEDLKMESSCEQILKWTEKVLNGEAHGDGESHGNGSRSISFVRQSERGRAAAAGRVIRAKTSTTVSGFGREARAGA